MLKFSFISIALTLTLQGICVHSSQSHCAPSITHKYLLNIATNIEKQAELLTKVDLADKALFQTKIDEQIEAVVRLEEDVDTFIKENEDITSSCIGTDWMNELTGKKNEAKAATEKMHTRLLEKKDAVVRLAAAQVKEGLLNEAVTQFKILCTRDGEAESELADIINRAYANKTEFVKNSLLFLGKVPWCSQVAIGLNLMFDAMAANQQLHFPEVLLLTGEGRGDCLKWLKPISTKQAPYTRGIIEKWTRDIGQGDFANITGFFKIYGENIRLNDILDLHIPEIIRGVFAGHISNFENVFQFVSKQPWMSSKAEGFKALYEEMTKSGHVISPEFFRVIYAVKTSTKYVKSLNPTPRNLENLGRLEMIAKYFPKVLREIIWSGDDKRKCLITAQHWNENLFASQNHKTLDGDRKVFTRISSFENRTPDLKEFWKFEAVDGDAESLHIANSHWNGTKYLTQDVQSQYDALRINIITTSKDAENNLTSSKQLRWKVVPHFLENGGTSAIVSLKNDFGNFYLYAGNSTFNLDDERRLVFTLSKRTVPAASRWRISCQ